MWWNQLGTICLSKLKNWEGKDLIKPYQKITITLALPETLRKTLKGWNPSSDDFIFADLVFAAKLSYNFNVFTILLY